MNLKNFLLKAMLPFTMSICVASNIANSALNGVGNSITDEYIQLVSDVEHNLPPDNPTSGMVKAFDKHASKLLLKWQHEASKEIVSDITILDKCKSTSCIESMLAAIDRLKSRGVEGRGAALKLVELLGSGFAILPPELFFWKSATEVRIEAANAIVNMNEAGAIALVYAYSHDFDGISREYAFSAKSKDDKRAVSYFNRVVTANQAIQSMFSIPVNKKNIKPRESWIALLLKSKPEDFLRTKTGKQSPEKQSEQVQIDSGIPWYENEFLVALLIGAVIVIGIRVSK